MCSSSPEKGGRLRGEERIGNSLHRLNTCCCDQEPSGSNYVRDIDEMLYPLSWSAVEKPLTFFVCSFRSTPVRRSCSLHIPSPAGERDYVKDGWMCEEEEAGFLCHTSGMRLERTCLKCRSGDCKTVHFQHTRCASTSLSAVLCARCCCCCVRAPVS